MGKGERALDFTPSSLEYYGAAATINDPSKPVYLTHESVHTKVEPKKQKVHSTVDAPALWVIITTYLSYAILSLVGRIRDFIACSLYPENYTQYKPRNGYAPLMDLEETLYHRRIYLRIRDCFNKAITNVPGRVITVLDRESEDNNATFSYTGTTSDLLNMSSYNYLGFAQSQGPCADAVEATVAKYGLSLNSPRMEVGNSVMHRDVEQLVARFVGQEDAVIFSMGFATNSTTIPALASKGTLIVSDELNHASLRYGCRVSGATLVTFKHNDIKMLEHVIRRNLAQGQPRSGRPWDKVLVIVEGLYSMEGTFCKLNEIVALKDKYKFYLYVDEAHSIGALGPNGRGICDLLNVNPARIDVLMGTFTKSFGAAGGYVSGTKALCDQIRLHNHSAVYAETVSPLVLQQIYSSMSIIMGEDGTDEGRHRLHRLSANSRYIALRLRELGLSVSGDIGSPVIPILVYHPSKLVSISRELTARGIAVVIVGYPATPLAEGRIRLCVSAAHTHDDCERLVNELSDLADKNMIRYCKPTVKG
ncbi:hypothetical protein SmJEL517_g06155 [Synchytrium microbalum]|uniref:serine C-palmitoyltransferase n=1 Tax=Synchytrium microbalum TaxID=1806994 RepID=A0A507BRW2_9FUNG|nr:uncharacterized protein SmJEL517_g06155 [Synchytrium microbalum]TPX30238.1 hypothetical protein SmJEL517_g06155 [Synchytrium microbalum]